MSAINKPSAGAGMMSRHAVKLLTDEIEKLVAERDALQVTISQIWQEVKPGAYLGGNYVAEMAMVKTICLASQCKTAVSIMASHNARIRAEALKEVLMEANRRIVAYRKQNLSLGAGALEAFRCELDCRATEAEKEADA